MSEFRENASDFSEIIEIKTFFPKIVEENPKENEVEVTQTAVPQRKKRSFLPLNIDDYEKRRSARSVCEIDERKKNLEGFLVFR